MRSTLVKDGCLGNSIRSVAMSLMTALACAHLARVRAASKERLQILLNRANDVLLKERKDSQLCTKFKAPNGLAQTTNQRFKPWFIPLVLNRFRLPNQPFKPLI